MNQSYLISSFDPFHPPSLISLIERGMNECLQLLHLHNGTLNLLPEFSKTYSECSVCDLSNKMACLVACTNSSCGVSGVGIPPKTFILKDFFPSRGWIFCELLPPDCIYFNSPRMSGRVGGIVTVYSKSYICKQVMLTASYSSFAMNFFELGSVLLVLCAVIDRPPKYNEDFIGDFADFLAGIMLKYGWVYGWE